MRGPTDYSSLLVEASGPDPEWATEAQERVHRLLMKGAVAFAANCNASPAAKFPHDDTRRPNLRYGRGLGADEAAGFLRALDEGLVTVEPDGAFFIPTARACSKNLHLVGRNEDHVAVHTEVLVHVAAYAELVLDEGWNPACIAFDPFTRGAALDLWGFHAPARKEEHWWDGTITFAAEAKARVAGSDSLTALAAAFVRLEQDRAASATSGQRRKWDELASIVQEHGSVEFLLVADGARWWYHVTAPSHIDEGPRLLRRSRDGRLSPRGPGRAGFGPGN